ncbi:hypothetical protein CAOG_02871 [Capsaspora owczarzaki ATCC 30864]|uniref:VPS9 domain-containing protein n=1 Tax=Capsaspora owczarzaki (strain ATCC 30864) TaxID=595528 RepID=A0A0D2U9N6_CAPO3|nr:hypothetical protein CAOG_02871 [Capsaspora owczarzaki ATCC 30864]KJE91786.1 hypothetical protein CAOG_002871 [Capsaspora owczarzaki ATCC 30864]|eukprot:XP_004363710.2 hypothetical protein CAOG_02871 [Capsaspora owczarzaki ATCC 30864]
MQRSHTISASVQLAPAPAPAAGASAPSMLSRMQFTDAVRSIAADLDDIMRGIYASADSFILAQRQSAYALLNSGNLDDDDDDESDLMSRLTSPSLGSAPGLVNSARVSVAGGQRGSARSQSLSTGQERKVATRPVMTSTIPTAATASTSASTNTNRDTNTNTNTNAAETAMPSGIGLGTTESNLHSHEAAQTTDSMHAIKRARRTSDRLLLESFFSLKFGDSVMDGLAPVAEQHGDAPSAADPVDVVDFSEMIEPIVSEQDSPSNDDAAARNDPDAEGDEIEAAVQAELRKLEAEYGVTIGDQDPIDVSNEPAEAKPEPLYAAVNRTNQASSRSSEVANSDYDFPQDHPYASLIEVRPNPALGGRHTSAIYDRVEVRVNPHLQRVGKVIQEYANLSNKSIQPDPADPPADPADPPAELTSSGSLSFKQLPKPPPAPAAMGSSNATSQIAAATAAAGGSIPSSEARPAAKSSFTQTSKSKDAEKPKGKFTITPVTDFVKQMAFKRMKSRNNVAQGLVSFFSKTTTSKNTPEGRTIAHFLECTRESKDTTAQMLCSNVRQFVDGMTNYIVDKRGRDVEGIVAKFAKDPAIMMLNVDAIIEGALQQSIIAPLKPYICRRLMTELQIKGSIQQFAANSREIAMQTPAQVGIRDKFVPAAGWGPAIACLQKMYRVTLPLRKLEYLLATVTSIHSLIQESAPAASEGAGSNEPFSVVLGADDFLPIFIYVLALSGLDTAEVEAEYMWGLLDPALLTGEGGYYLTVLSSAIHVVKTLQAAQPLAAPPSEAIALAASAATSSSKNTVPARAPRVADMQGFLRVYFSDDDLRVFKTLPVRPLTSAREAITLIVEKMRLPPGRYGLFELRNGVEFGLEDSQQPQAVKGNWPLEGSDDLYQIIFRRLRD